MCRSAWSAGKGKVYGLQGFLTTRSTPLLVLCRPLLPSATRSIQSSAGHDAWPGSEVQTPQFGGGRSATEEHALDQCCGTATGLSTSVNSGFARSGSWRWLASASASARSCLPSADRGTGRETRTRSPDRDDRQGLHALGGAMAAPSWLELQGDDERVFCHPERGTVYRAETFVDALALALRSRASRAGPRVPRPEAHGDHERRCCWCEPDCADDEGRPLGHEDDEAVPASRGSRVSRRGRAARSELLGAGDVSTQLSTHLSEPDRIERHEPQRSCAWANAVDPSDEIQLF